MKNIKHLLLAIGITLPLIPNVLAACNGWFNLSSNCESKPVYCNGGECGLWEGFLATMSSVGDHLSNEPISVLAQDMVNYFLSFVSIVAVIYIMYAGFQLMIGAGDEEKMKKTKNIILYVIVGIIIMWLSNSIVRWIIALISA